MSCENGGQQKIKIVCTNQQSNLRGSFNKFSLPAPPYPGGEHQKSNFDS